MKFNPFLNSFHSSYNIFEIYCLQSLNIFFIGHQSRNGAQQHQLLPPNYDIIFEFIKLAYKAMLVFLGLGIMP